MQEQLRILMGAIARLGHQDHDGWSVSFGTLFLAYQDISDAVGGSVLEDDVYVLVRCVWGGECGYEWGWGWVVQW